MPRNPYDLVGRKSIYQLAREQEQREIKECLGTGLGVIKENRVTDQKKKKGLQNG